MVNLFPVVVASMTAILNIFLIENKSAVDLNACGKLLMGMQFAALAMVEKIFQKHF